MARLADPEDERLSIAFDAEFGFTEESRYQALQRDSEQAQAIDAYEKEVKLKVYYQLYNTWSLPYVQRVPLNGYAPPAGTPELGVRVIPSALVHATMSGLSERSPAPRDLAHLTELPSCGWRLEGFICDELLGCREGDEFAFSGDDRIGNLFFRRSGPISAAIAITIEAPGTAA